MTYEYKCDRCGLPYTICHAISHPVVEAWEHTECHEGRGMFRLVVTGGVGTIFVGGGWTPKG